MPSPTYELEAVSVQEKINRAIHEIVGSLFDGQSHTIDGQSIVFPKCIVAYDRRYITELDAPSANQADASLPRIIFTGTTTRDTRTHVKGYSVTKHRPVFQERTPCVRNVFVRAQYNTISSQRDLADKIYGILHLAFIVNKPAFQNAGIAKLEMPSVADDITSDQYVLLSSKIRFETHMSFCRDGNV